MSCLLSYFNFELSFSYFFYSVSLSLLLPKFSHAPPPPPLLSVFHVPHLSISIPPLSFFFFFTFSLSFLFRHFSQEDFLMWIKETKAFVSEFFFLLRGVEMAGVRQREDEKKGVRRVWWKHEGAGLKRDFTQSASNLLFIVEWVHLNSAASLLYFFFFFVCYWWWLYLACKKM